jgi:mycoredoxin
MNADNMITMYSTTWCGDCQVAKTFLKKLAIPFEEVNIEEHPDAADYVMKVNNGKRSVPTLVVNGEATSLSGFSRAKFDAFLQKHQLATPLT